MATANPYLKGLATGGTGINQTTSMTAKPMANPMIQNLGMGTGTMQTMGPQPQAAPTAQTLGTLTTTQPSVNLPSSYGQSTINLPPGYGSGGSAGGSWLNPQQATGPQPLGGSLAPTQSMQPQTSNLGMGGPTMGGAEPSTAGSTPAWMSPTTPATMPQTAPGMGTPFNGSGAPTMGQGGMGVNPALAGGSQAPKTLAQLYQDRQAFMQAGKPKDQGGSYNLPPGWTQADLMAASKASTGQSQEADDAQTQAYRALQTYKQGMGPNPNGGPNHAGQMGSMQGQPGNGQPLGMGGTGQNLGMGGAWNQYTPSPYLQQGLDGLQGQFNQNLTENILPGIQSNAVAAGGLGGSRQGLAQGRAIADSQTGFANAATNMLGADYQAQMARNLQNKGLDQSLYLGNQANDTARFGITTGANTAKYNTDAQSATAAGQLGLGYANNALQGALGFAGLDQAKYNTDAQTGIAQGQLGLGYLNANNNFTLGSQSNANQATGLANSYQLGTVANQNTANANANAYQLGTVANQNAANQNANSYQIQSVANQNNANANNNAFYLGQQQNTTQAQQVANNYALGNQGQQLNFYGDMRNQDRADLGLGAALYGQGVNGQWGPLNNYNGLISPYSGQGTTNQTTGGQSGGWQGLLGGGMQGYALAKSMGLLG